MNVLSLFDGMSCGRIALDRASIPVANYYASEIDKFAIKVSEANYPDILRLGDVSNWKEWDIDWSSIDLLIAGSPCQGFSFAGEQLGFDDPRSKLFFVFIDILNHIKRVNPSVKFMLENVRMKNKYLNVITSTLCVDPENINSNLITCANRNRFYWANFHIENLEKCHVHPENFSDFGIPMTIGSSKDRVFRKTYYFGALTASMYKGLRASGRPILAKPYCEGVHIDKLKKGIDYRGLTIEECERLQTVPVGYCKHVSKTQAYKMLGNGWTVDVIAHIFRGLK
tara:strand:- start:35381 stop:36229 length:849 start_codon:yes stop_codon:yes gene_type:complete